MAEIIKSLVVGMICGGVFTLVKLPIPAPGVLPGVIGIIGVYIGYVIVKHFI